MIEYIFICLGTIIITIFITALILDHKLKQHEKKEFYKNLQRHDKNRL